MHAQAQPRLAKRMPCAVRVGQRRYTGMVINLSQGGLFVQTNADTGRGERVDLEISAPEQTEAIPVQGTVVWRRAVPPQLRSAARGGMGVRIQSAAEVYYQLLAAWMRVAPVAASAARAAAAAARAAPGSTWRVRVRATTGPRTRSLSIEAASAEEARAEAMRCVGAGWSVLDIVEL